MDELTIKVPALRIHQKEGEGKAIYVARVTVKELASRRRERFDVRYYARVNGKDSGYQRRPTPSKLSKIKDFIDKETDAPLFPTSIVVSTENELEFDEINRGYGLLTLKPKLYIIDGQHRFEAWGDLMDSHVYKELEDYEIPLVVLSGFEEIDEVAQFHIINSRQTKVKTDLAHRHYLALSKSKKTAGLVREEDTWIPRANVVANQLNEEIDGVWKVQMLNANETMPDIRRKLPIGVSGFASSLKPLFAKGKLFSDPTNQDNNAKFLAKFWEVASEVWPEPFENPKDYVLMKTVGTYSMHLLLLELNNDYKDQNVLLEKVKSKLLEAKEKGYTSDYWFIRRHLSDNRKRTGKFAAANSSASGHVQIMTSLLHPGM